MTSPDTQERRLKESQLARARALAGIDTTDLNACVPGGGGHGGSCQPGT